LWRDWSNDGQKERDKAYGPVIRALEDEYLVTAQNESTIGQYGSQIDSIASPTGSLLSVKSTETLASEETITSRRILIPGAGLCRLAFDLHHSDVGFAVEANELSYYHLLAIQWLSQSINEGTKFTLFPWVSQFSNHVRSSRQFEGYNVPEGPVLPQKLSYHIGNTGLSLKGSENNGSPSFVITTHDFHLYREPQYAKSFDVVATVFFVDTAPNIRDYITIINHVLPVGGLWVNNGPLLWNCWENGPPARGEGDPEDNEAARDRHNLSLTEENKEFNGKVELSWEELIYYIEHMGFKVEQKNVTESSGYILDEQSMLHSNYRLGFFKARKVADIHE
jgi:carnosine N-methyltransferase